MRFIGLDVHRDFCEVAISDGGKARSAGRVKTTRAELGRSLGCDDRVVLEATGNSLAIARILEPHVGEVVIANARKLKAISHAKLKNDRVDARRLAELLAAVTRTRRPPGVPHSRDRPARLIELFAQSLARPIAATRRSSRNCWPHAISTRFGRPIRPRGPCDA